MKSSVVNIPALYFTLHIYSYPALYSLLLIEELYVFPLLHNISIDILVVLDSGMNNSYFPSSFLASVTSAFPSSSNESFPV